MEHRYQILCSAILSSCKNFLLCVVLRYVMLYYVIYSIMCHVMLCNLCYNVLRYVMLECVMSWYVM